MDCQIAHQIDAARLIVLNAAAAIDAGDAKTALVEIAQAKILVPSMALEVIDRAVQTYGAQGICQDTPLAYMWANGESLLNALECSTSDNSSSYRSHSRWPRRSSLGAARQERE